MKKKEILLVQNLKESKSKDYWGLPGGSVETGETSTEAMRREWEEETGQKKINLDPNCVVVVEKMGSRGNYTHYFFYIEASQEVLKKDGTPGEAGPPTLIPIRDIISEKTKMFRGHIKGTILVLEKMAEGRGKTNGGRYDKHGIKIMSSAPQAALSPELLESLKSLITK